jgi:hypothetical protein
MNPPITKFISWKCVSYDPETGRSEWHIIAQFKDGKVREIYLWFGSNGTCTGQEAGWLEIPEIYYGFLSVK